MISERTTYAIVLPLTWFYGGSLTTQGTIRA